MVSGHARGHPVNVTHIAQDVGSGTKSSSERDEREPVARPAHRCRACEGEQVPGVAPDPQRVHG